MNRLTDHSVHCSSIWNAQNYKVTRCVFKDQSLEFLIEKEKNLPLFWTQPSLTTFWSLMVASPRDQFSQLSQYGDREGTVVGGLAGQWVCLKLSQLSVWPLDLFSSDFKFFHSLPNRLIFILLLSTITYSFLLLPFWPNLTFSCCLSSRLVFLTVFTFFAPSFPPSFLPFFSLPLLQCSLHSLVLSEFFSFQAVQ